MTVLKVMCLGKKRKVQLYVSFNFLFKILKCYYLDQNFIPEQLCQEMVLVYFFVIVLNLKEDMILNPLIAMSLNLSFLKSFNLIMTKT